MVAFWIVLALLLALGAVQVYVRRGLAPARQVETRTPEGLPWRPVWFATRRNKQLFGWFIPYAVPPGAAPAPALAIVHGWSGNAEVMLPLAQPLHEAGYSLLLFDARCHGQSDDDDHVSLPRFAEDLSAAVDWLHRQDETRASPVGVIGHSVGAAACLLLASRRADIGAVLSIAAFSHPASMMRRWLAARRIPFWPIGAYILHYIQRVIGARFDDIAPRHTIARVSCPVLLVHGCDDDTVPLAEAEEIYAQRRHEHVHLLPIPGSHDEYGDMSLHLEQAIAFLDTAFAKEPRNENG